MKIDSKLNLIVPVERENGQTIYVHSTPISREVWEQNFLVISKTFAGIYAEGLNIHTGPRIAALMLKRIAQQMDAWDGPNGIESTLVAEIRRLTNVVMPSDSGWTTIPMQEAVNRKLFDADDLSEVDNAITFFIVASAMHKKKEAGDVIRGAARLWGAQTTSLNSTAYAASLPTSTATASSGVTAGA